MNWQNFNEILAKRDSGAVEESIVKLEKLITPEEDKLTHAALLIEIVNSLRMLKRFSEAYSKIDQACALLQDENEYYPRAAFIRGALEMDMGNWKVALERFDEITAKYGHVHALNGSADLMEDIKVHRGMVLTELRRFHEARNLLDSHRSDHRDRSAILCYLGTCSYELKDYDRASRDFEELLSIHPNSSFRAWAHYHLGRIWYRRGQYARAKLALESCLACTDRGKVPVHILLQGLVNSCKALNLGAEAARYLEMDSQLP